MKKISLVLSMFFIISALFAQVPQSFKYQAIARNNEGAPITNSSIGVRVIILSGNANGTEEYSENFIPVSNAIGIFSINIGEGNPLSGNFSDIDWGSNDFFLNIAIDPDGGSNYTDMGTVQLLSVPYSLYTGSIYVHYSNDTLYIGDQYVIIPGGSPGPGSVNDYDGNTYDVVTIGDQVWLKQNLRSLHYADGTPIDSVWVYDDNESNAAVWGRLYSWDAAMNGATSSNGNPSGVQGVCPNGWHLPSQAEFEQLIDFVGGTSTGGCALKSTNDAYWNTPNDNNNSSGFSARGSGMRTDPGFSYEHLKEDVRYWSTTEDTNNEFLANHMNLSYQYCTVNISSIIGTKNTGYSIRCVKD